MRYTPASALYSAYFVVFIGLTQPQSALAKSPMDVKDIEAISDEAQFVKVGEELSEGLKLRFATLARIAKLEFTSEAKKLYPVSFGLMAADAKLDKLIILGTQRVSGQHADRLYKIPRGVYAPVVLETKPVSIIFSGFTAIEAERILQEYNQTYASSREVVGSQRAPASEVRTTTTMGAPSTHETVPSSQSLQYAYALDETFGKCGLGAVDEFNKPVKNASWNRSNRATNTRAWVETSASELQAIKENLLYFDKFAESQWSDWRKKSAQEKSKFYCSFFMNAGGFKVLKGATAAFKDALSKIERAGAASLAKLGKAPKDLDVAASAIIEPNKAYMGLKWWVVPRGGSSNYPYLADRKSLEYLDALNKGPLPNPESITDPSKRAAVTALKTFPEGAQERIKDALASPDVTLNGKSYAVVGGGKYGNVRLATSTDYKPISKIEDNVLTGQRQFADDKSFRSISTSKLVYQGSGQTGRSTATPSIQGEPVRIVVGEKVVEGQYLSSAGPGVPRGAAYSELAEGWHKHVEVHFVKVGDQTVMVPAQGAEIFARY